MPRLGVIVPSSNTVVEPGMARLLAAERWVTTHVARLRVTHIEAAPAADMQFGQGRFIEAASLLADAGVDLILWSGTAASWLGFARDAALVAAIEARLGIPATTAVLAINAALARLPARRIGLVTPYVAAVEAGIVANYAACGIAVAAAARCDLTDNAAFAHVPQQAIEQMIRDTARTAPDAVVVMCTNLDAALLAERLTHELGIPIIDSVRESTLHSVAALRRRQAVGREP